MSMEEKADIQGERNLINRNTKNGTRVDLQAARIGGTRVPSEAFLKDSHFMQDDSCPIHFESGRERKKKESESN